MVQRSRVGLSETKEQLPSSSEEIPEFHFRPITPEDWRADEAPIADLYQRRIVSAEYVRDRLNIPQEAGQGTMAPEPQAAPKPLSDVPGGLPGGRSERKRNPTLMVRARRPR